MFFEIVVNSDYAKAKAISIISLKVVSRSLLVVRSPVTKESEIVKILKALTLCFAAIVYNPADSMYTQSTPNFEHFL